MKLNPFSAGTMVEAAKTCPTCNVPLVSACCPICKTYTFTLVHQAKEVKMPAMKPWEFIPNLDPQQARGKLSPEMWVSANYIGEEKYDGERRLGQFCSVKGPGSALVRLTGRPSKVKGVPIEKTDQLPQISGMKGYITETGKVLTLKVPDPPAELDGCVVDGEVVLPPDYENPRWVASRRSSPAS